jgi:methylphosphotriester-DNA--protein-cysteine methyltransferase
MKIIYSLLIAAALLAGCGTEAEEDGTRIGNQQTKVFHTTNCRFIPEIQQKVNFANRQAALDAGYRPDESNACDP